MKRISLSELEYALHLQNYQQLYEAVLHKIEQGEIKPVKASGKNGKKPVLYREYWMIEQARGDEEELVEELSYQYVPAIATGYYMKHLQQYREDREWLMLLNQYLREHKCLLEFPMSLNERSYDIWHREKFLKEEQGRKILKRCGISLEMLNLYETSEPLAYYTDTKEIPQNILLVENKDTFYSIRRNLLAGKNKILGITIGTVIYGAGKGILRSFQDFTLCCEPYMKNEANRLLYFGDLDYEGIMIYEKLADNFLDFCIIEPFVPGYHEMLHKAALRGQERLPHMKEKQNHNIGMKFLEYFSVQDRQYINGILAENRYIPQEILNGEDFNNAI